MNKSNVDPFTLKRIKETFEGADEVKMALDLAKEFGSRVGYAHGQGLSRDVAIEACRVHFKNVGKAMVDLADTFADLLLDNP